MKRMRTGRRLGVLLAIGGVAALIVSGLAFAHARISPAVATPEGQVYTLVVPTESENASTTTVELTPPADFTLRSFRPAPGWTRDVQATGEGEDAVIEKVTWSGGDAGPGDAAYFDFFGSGDSAKTYSFKVRQTYSDGEVVDWAGPESSDEPAPTVELESSLGGGGGSKTLEVIALALAGLAIVIAVFGLIGGTGRRAIA
jgi:uncharacterized protein YcnI